MRDVPSEDRDFDDSDSTVRILNFLQATGHSPADSDLEKALRRLLLHEKLLWRSGFFYGHRSDWTRKLESSPPGTFLVRYSSDPTCLYTLSFNESFKSVSHMRIYIRNGWFTLFDNHLRPGHAFEGVLEMIESYRRRPPRVQLACMPHFGKTLLFKVPSLRHLCLRRVAGAVRQSPRTPGAMGVDRLGLERGLDEALRENAFPVDCIYRRIRPYLSN